MYYDVLAKQVRHFKENEGAYTQMCKLMEDMCREVAAEVEARVAYEAAIKSAVETARRYNLTDAMILKDIMNEFQLTEAEAKAYMEKKPA